MTSKRILRHWKERIKIVPIALAVLAILLPLRELPARRLDLREGGDLRRHRRPDRGQLRRPKERRTLSDYVRLVLEDHVRKGVAA